MPSSRKRMPSWAKIMIGTALVIAPIGAMMAMLLSNTSYRIDFARWEMYGTRYLRPASRLLGATVRYTSAARGSVSTPGLEAQIESELRALQEVDDALSQPLKTTQDELGARGRDDSQPVKLEALWRQIRQQDGQSKAAPALVAAIRALISHVGDSSLLILDPDLDTYYTMDALLLKQPDIVQWTSELGDRAADLASEKGLTLQARGELSGRVVLLSAAVDALESDVETAFRETQNFNKHHQLKAALEPRVRATAAAVKRLTALVRLGLVEAPSPTASAANVEQAAAAAHDVAMQLWADLFDHQDRMLNVRLGKELNRRRNVFWSALAVVAVLSVLVMLLMRNSRVLRSTIGALQQSLAMLHRAVEQIDEHNNAHEQDLVRQAAALQQTQTTAQQIKQTSQVAARSAVGILEVVERADTLGRAGETAIEASLHGLQDIREQFSELAVKIRELNDRTAQISGITRTVKDLADQSNILALNAAIEAARSGEHGKGFSVVAREIRQLANQSIQATSRVQELLGSIGNAIHQTVSFAETGGQRIEIEVGQVRQSGESLRELSKIVQQSSSGVRQIANAVSEQNAGISQIFTAVIDQNRMMDDTVRRLDDTRQATDLVKTASRSLTATAERLRV
jgi:methyl-accepting chemotaxis protein